MTADPAEEIDTGGTELWSAGFMWLILSSGGSNCWVKELHRIKDSR
jgi:hypothetical protein